MFQSFDVTSDPANGAKRLALLREELARRGLDGFIIPRADEHQGEYVPPEAERLAWLTGFTGSAGIAATLGDRAAFFTDGRYTLQAERQVDGDAFERLNVIKPGLHDWLKDHLKPGQKLAFDPWLHTGADRKKLEKTASRTDAELVAVDTNPLDAVWADRPAPPSAAVDIHPPQFAGQSASDKRADIAEAITEAGADSAVITEPDAIAWMINIRGGDLPHLPVALGFAIAHSDGKTDLFMDENKFGDEARAHIEDVAALHPRDAFKDSLETLGMQNKRVIVDPARAPVAVKSILEDAGARIIEAKDPTVLLKAVKNATEIAGARAAHIRDGVAYARFLQWLDNADVSKLDEITVAKKLEALRAETGELRDISFDTISGFGPNGAVIHYRVTTETNLPFESDALYLVDSGAQYRDGTTDITRTIAIGTPTGSMRRHYTLVLKGHVAISLARFPVGTSGAQIDTMARYPLWQAGLDYEHGTGHGVGSYLSVHEGPQNISKRGAAELKSSMILSNEPGYYRAGEYGIRIENLVIVNEPEKVEGGEKELLSFETITLAPYDRRLIDAALLSDTERTWIDAYHARVFETLSPDLGTAERDWLKAATVPL